MRLRSDSAQHGLSAFSAHLAGELGDGPGTRGLFTSLYDEEQSIDSGDETETESHVQNYARRSRRRSSLFADNDKQRYTLYREPPQEQQDELRASLTAEQLHTASLGLHRSFSLAGIQHFLIDSVYNSLSSSMLGTPRSQSGSLSPSHIQANSFMSARRRTHSAPSVERSHSSGDLYAQANQSEQQAEIREFKVAVSYWRRVLRSFNF